MSRKSDALEADVYAVRESARKLVELGEFLLMDGCWEEVVAEVEKLMEALAHQDHYLNATGPVRVTRRARLHPR